MNDPISPNHYKMANGEVEVIDIIRETVNDFASYCHGNVIKYILRANKKSNGTNDYKKAEVYLRWLIEDLEKDSLPSF